jgi:hypothetical protein
MAYPMPTPSPRRAGGKRRARYIGTMPKTLLATRPINTAPIASAAALSINVYSSVEGLVSRR